VDNKFGGRPDTGKRGLERAGDQLEDRASCHAVRNDLAVVEVHAGRQVELVAVHIELGDVGRPLLVGRGRAEVALQNVGHVLVAHAWDMPGALLRPDQRTQPHHLHQTLYALVIDGHLERTGQRSRDPSVAVAALVLVVDGPDPGFHGAPPVGTLGRLAVVVERAARQACYLQ